MRPEASIAIKTKLFRHYQQGARRSLVDLLEAEREQLYDYLMRMTGQIARSFDSVHDVMQSLGDDEAGQLFSDLEDLRICLYTTGRKFNADIWNADTAKLMNPEIEPVAGAASGDDGLQAFRSLDKSLRALAGPEREVILLRSRSQFDFDAIATIMNLPAATIEAHFDRGMQRIDAECSGLVEQPEKMLAWLPSHPPPETSAIGTMNLSMMMQDIKVKPTGLWSPLRLALVGLIVLLGALYLFAPAKMGRLLKGRWVESSESAGGVKEAKDD